MLHLEPVIVERLRAVLPKGVRVMSAADLAGVKDMTQFAPSVSVMYQGYRVKKTEANDMVSLVEQTWLTVIVTRNVRDQKAGTAARTDAGPIGIAIHGALAGWLPEGACRNMRLTDAPNAGSEAGLFYMPLAWKTEVQFVNDMDDDFPVLKRVTNDYTGDDVQEIPNDDDVQVPGDDGDGPAPEDR